MRNNTLNRMHHKPFDEMQNEMPIVKSKNGPVKSSTKLPTKPMTKGAAKFSRKDAMKNSRRTVKYRITNAEKRGAKMGQ